MMQASAHQGSLSPFQAAVRDGPFGPFRESVQHSLTSVRDRMLGDAAMILSIVPPVREPCGGDVPPITIRRVDRADAPALSDFYAALPEEDRRLRFLGTSRGPGLGFCEGLCSNDHVHAEGFVAVLATPDRRDGRIVGHLCLVPDDAWTLEIGVAVAAEFQGRGVGRRLFEAALDWAGTEGIHALHATCFADNIRVLRLLTSAPGSRIDTTDDPVLVQVEIQVPVSVASSIQPESPRATP